MALINNFGGSNLFRNLQTGSKNQINKNPQISLNKESQKLEMGQKIELGQLNGSGKTTLDGQKYENDMDFELSAPFDASKGQLKTGDTIYINGKKHIVTVVATEKGEGVFRQVTYQVFAREAK